MTKTDYITVVEEPVVPAPKIDFSGDPTSGVAPLTVNFTATNTGGNVTTWAWDFGDNTTSNVQDPSHTYTAVGNYTVTLTATGPGGNNTVTKTDYITVVEEPVVPAPKIDFSGDPTSGVAPLTVNFTATNTGGNVTTWAWDFGDNTTSNVQDPSHTYTAVGNYTVTLTATGPGGNNTVTKVGYITALESPQANFTATPTTGPAPLAVQFIDNSTGNPISWSWDFGDERSATTKNPGVTYQKPGIYNVNLTVTYNDGSSLRIDHCINVTQPKPVAAFTADPMTGGAPLIVGFSDTSSGSPDIWSWNFGDGNTSTEQHPEHTYTKAGTYTVKLTASNGAGSNITSKNIIVNPVADFIANTTRGDASLTVQFSDASTGIPDNWSWNFGDGNTSTDQSPTHTYAATGTYTVKLTAKKGDLTSTETKEAFITVVDPADPPTARFRANTTQGYASLAVQFSDQSGGNVTGRLWNFGDGEISTDQSPTHTYATPGTYTVTLTATGPGGSNTITKAGYITVLDPTPIVAISSDKVRGETPLTVHFTSESAGIPPLKYFWDFGDNTNSTHRNSTHVFEYTGDGAKTYTVTLTVTNAKGTSASTTTKITVVSPPRNEVVSDRIDTTTNKTTVDVPLTYQKLELKIPKNTTATVNNEPIKNLSVQVAPDLKEPSAGTIKVGEKAFKLGPEGAKFEPSIPITITFTDDEWKELFGDGRTTELQKFDGANWIVLPNLTIDHNNRTLTAYTDSFSIFAPITTEPTPTTEPTTPSRPSTGSGGSGPAYVSYTGTGTLKINNAGTVLQSVRVAAVDQVGSAFVPIGTKALDKDGKPLTTTSIAPLSSSDMPAVFERLEFEAMSTRPDATTTHFMPGKSAVTSPKRL